MLAHGNPVRRKETAGLAAHRRDRNGRAGRAFVVGVDARQRRCDKAPASVPLHGVGTAPKQNCQVMGRRRACLPIPEGS